MSDLETTDQEILLEDNCSADDEDESTHDEDGTLDKYEKNVHKIEQMNTISLKLKKAPTKKKTIQNQMVKGQKKEVNDEDDDDEVEVIEDKQNKKEESGDTTSMDRSRQH